LNHSFEEIICLDNLLAAWREFARGKRGKKDVQEFEWSLMDNIIALQDDLASGNYRHGDYKDFHIDDPKPRHIHKAGVRDRLVHHAVYRILYPYFDKKFIADSYSCRLDKGTCKALNRFRQFAYQVGRNNTRACWILKGDIRKFFASIDQRILKIILAEYIGDKKILDLLDKIINSFGITSRGLPLGNLTSQLLVNIYMNKFDQFVKNQLKAKYYIRYADDFIIFSENKNYLDALIPQLDYYLTDKLKLKLHPNKIFIKTLGSGVDFLGWVNFPHHRVLRTVTKRRMLKRIGINPSRETLASYLGLLSHGNTYKLLVKLPI